MKLALYYPDENLFGFNQIFYFPAHILDVMYFYNLVKFTVSS